MKDFKIPKPVPPTKLESLGYAKRWFKELYGVKFTDWNSKLLDYTYPLHKAKLTPNEIRLIFNEEKSEKIRKRLMEKLEHEVSVFNGDPFFVKLISRSPKDWLIQDDNTCKKLYTATDIIESLGSSMRCFEDLVMLSHLNLDINLYLRPWKEIDPSTEWRCFIKNNKIIGITQYFHNEKFEYSDGYITRVNNQSFDFLNDIVIPNMIVSDFVADLIITTNDRPILLETNPYGLSDPCMFISYKELEESNEILRYNK